MKIKTDPIDLKTKGRFSLSVMDKFGNELKEKRIEDCSNVVTYEGAYKIFFGGGTFSDYHAVIGTGVSEITRTSQGLGNQVHKSSQTATASRAGNEIDNGDGTSTLTLTRTISFPLSGTIGTFSEVGVVHFDNTFIAGQLIKDEFGDPTTITIQDEEQLNVTYTLELIVPNGEVIPAPIIGTGTVSTPEGSSTYNIYEMSYFRNYTIGSSNNSTTGPGYANLLDSTGQNNLLNNAVSAGRSISRTLGEVTCTYHSINLSPSALDSDDIAYAVWGNFVNNNGTFYKIDPTTKRQDIDDGSYASLIVEFSPPLVKDFNRKLVVGVEVTYNI